MTFLRVCHEIWVFGVKITPGMHREMQCAKKLKKPIRFFTVNCEEVKDVKPTEYPA